MLTSLWTEPPDSCCCLACLLAVVFGLDSACSELAHAAGPIGSQMASSLPGSPVRPGPQTLTAPEAWLSALSSPDVPVSCGPWLLRFSGKPPFPSS